MNRWTKYEIRLLEKNYSVKTNNELLELFPNKTPLAVYKKGYNLGMRKDKSVEFKNRSLARSREKSANWNGGREKCPKGYIMLLDKSHPNSDVAGYIMEHRVIMEQCIGRYLKPNEIVHHINGVKDDNHIANLLLMTDGEHTRLHHTGVKRSAKTCERISFSKRKKEVLI